MGFIELVNFHLNIESLILQLNLHIPYKGSRAYLHGTSFFDEVERVNIEMNLFPNLFLEKIIFRRFSINQCVLSLKNPIDFSMVVAQGCYSSLDKSVKKEFWILESGFKTTERITYDEDCLLAAAAICLDTKSIHRHGLVNSGTTIEEIVAFTKYLHNAVAAPNVGKWLFAQIELNQKLPKIFNNIEIQLTKMIANKFSISLVFLDGINVGSISFIVGGL